MGSIPMEGPDASYCLTAHVGADHFCAQLQNSTLVFVTLDDLYTLTGLPQAPVFLLGVRKILLLCVEAIFVRQHQLTGQVLHQRVLFNAHFGHRPDVMHGVDSFRSNLGVVCRWATNWRVISPKLTSVPSGDHVLTYYRYWLQLPRPPHTAARIRMHARVGGDACCGAGDRVDSHAGLRQTATIRMDRNTYTRLPNEHYAQYEPKGLALLRSLMAL